VSCDNYDPSTRRSNTPIQGEAIPFKRPHGETWLRARVRQKLHQPSNKARPAHSRTEDRKEEKTFTPNAEIVKEIVLRGGKDKEELLEALGLHSKYLGEYVALKGFTVIDHDVDLDRFGERVLAHKETWHEIVITNVGVPKKIMTIET
jgi:hypothetical protein